MTPRIELLPATSFIGQSIITSFANNKTRELWQGFSPRKAEIQNVISPDLYSIEIYSNTAFFEHFDPTAEFEKWAAVAVDSIDNIPENMKHLILKEGLYAVFNYKGKPSEASPTFQYIYDVWLPNSEFTLDDRPHFALMGDKYRGEDPESEEEFWIPIC